MSRYLRFFLGLKRFFFCWELLDGCQPRVPRGKVCRCGLGRQASSLYVGWRFSRLLFFLLFFIFLSRATRGTRQKVVSSLVVCVKSACVTNKIICIHHQSFPVRYLSVVGSSRPSAFGAPRGARTFEDPPFSASVQHHRPTGWNPFTSPIPGLFVVTNRKSTRIVGVAMHTPKLAGDTPKLAGDFLVHFACGEGQSMDGRKAFEGTSQVLYRAWEFVVLYISIGETSARYMHANIKGWEDFFEVQAC